jgi:Domain of unknown function (DUF4265)
MARRLIKVRFELDPADWHSLGGERLWAAPATEPGTFQLQNSPFYAIGVSHLDVVAVRPAEDNITFDFERVVERSGHSTYMLLLKADDADVQSRWLVLEKMGCTYESAAIKLSMGDRTLYSVDVPPTADLQQVWEQLAEGERAGAWLLQEGYAHLVKPS